MEVASKFFSSNSILDGVSVVKIKSLSEMCVDEVVLNFRNKPFNPTDVANARVANSITQKIPGPNQMDPLIAAKFIRDDSYWTRACNEMGFSSKRGQTDTRVYYENYLAMKIENFNETEDNTEDFLKMVEIFHGQLFTLKFNRFPKSGLKISSICNILSNLTRMEFQFGGVSCLSEITLSTVSDLSACINFSDCLTSLILRNNKLNCAHIEALVEGLEKLPTLAHLDLGFNIIEGKGAALLADKFLSPTNAIIVSLNMRNNMIDENGCKALGKSLRSNTSLSSLDVRFNLFGDSGGAELISCFRGNSTLKNLKISSNTLSHRSVESFCGVFEAGLNCLTNVDLSSNNLSKEDIYRLAASINSSETLLSIDLRMNPGSDMETLDQFVPTLRHNERALRENNSRKLRTI